jgi:hypothetical protein
MTRNEANTASPLPMSAPPSASRMNTKTTPMQKSSPPVFATSISPFATAARPLKGNGLASTLKAGQRSAPTLRGVTRPRRGSASFQASGARDCGS